MVIYGLLERNVDDDGVRAIARPEDESHGAIGKSAEIDRDIRALVEDGLNMDEAVTRQ